MNTDDELSNITKIHPGGYQQHKKKKEDIVVSTPTQNKAPNVEENVPSALSFNPNFVN